MLNHNAGMLADALGIEYRGDRNAVFSAVEIDSRKIRPGEMFAAFRGAGTDGNIYAAKALEAGASVLLLSDRTVFAETDANAFYSPDPQETVQEIASYIRKNAGKRFFAGITGSVGKTSTKEILYGILNARFRVKKTEGNRNNELGFPLTVSRLEEEDDGIILEMGMRGKGQVDFLCGIAAPDYGIITNIAPVHLELLGSMEDIADAKSEILKHIPSGGCAFLNSADCGYLEPFVGRCRGRVCWFGENEGDIILKGIVSSGEAGTVYQVEYFGREETFALPMIGRHQCINSLPCIGLAALLGMTAEEIREGLKSIHPGEMRFAITEKDGIRFINDAYNANPLSVIAALESLQKVGGRRKTAVIGDMYELGLYEREGHLEAGRAVSGKADFLVTVGELGKTVAEGAAENMDCDKIFSFEDKKEAVSFLAGFLQEGDTVLFKASRGMALEEMINTLMEAESV